MKMDRQRHGSVSVIVPHDALTETSVAELHSALAGETGQEGMRLVLDLARVPYVDSAGIEYLLDFAASAGVASMRPRLAALTDTVREALYLTDTLKRFYVFDTVEDAVRSYV